MIAHRSLNTRILAIAPTTRGFGFAVMERNGKLVDWGAVGITRDKNVNTLRKVSVQMEVYKPQVLAIEDCATSRYTRSRRVRALSNVLCRLAGSRGVLGQAIPIAAVRQKFCGERKATKHNVAECLAKMFTSELSHLMPRKRTTWTKEDYKMAIFEAVALAVAALSGVR